MVCNCYAARITMTQAAGCEKRVRLLSPHSSNTATTLLIAAAVLFAAGASALAQRVLGIDVSAWQDNNLNWATLKRATNQQVSGVYGDGRDFVFIRSSRGGTT